MVRIYNAWHRNDYLIFFSSDLFIGTHYNHLQYIHASRVSWDEWLGIMRSYEETKEIATKVLRLKSLDDYLIFIKIDAKRAEGMRIPVRPDLYYDEWIDEESFFGKREEEIDIDYDESFQ